MIMQGLSQSSGAIVLASSLGREASLESKQWRFQIAALETSVAGTNEDGFVDTDELTKHVTGAVQETNAGRQHSNVERDNPLQRFVLPTAGS